MGNALVANRSSVSIIVCAISLAALIFAVDVKLPLGISDGVLYVVVVMLGLWLPGIGFVLGLGVLSTVLTILGYFVSPDAGPEWMAVVNRGLALFAIWASALLVIANKRRDRTLNQYSARFRDFAETASDWFWEMDADLRFTYLSGPFDENLGQSADLSMGRTRQEIFADIIRSGTPEEQETWRRHFADLEARRPFKDFIQRWITPAGETRIFSNSGKPFFDDKGEFAGYRGTASNVTESVLAEQALRNSEGRYRALVESGTVGMLVFGADYRPIYVSQHAAEIFGYESASEMEALPDLNSILTENEVARTAERRQRRFAGEDVPTVYDIECRRKDGSAVWILQHSAVIEWDGERAILATITDITRQKKNEAEAKRQSAVVTALIDTLPAHISLRDRDARFIFVNRTMAEDYGGSIADFVGRKLTEVRGPVDGANVQSLSEKVLETGEPIRDFIFDPPRFPGRTFLANVLPVPEAGGVLAISLDITERVRVEKALRDSERQLRLVTDAVPALITYVDAAQRYQFVNEVAERWYARPSAEIVGHTVSEVLGRQSVEARRSLFEGVLSGIPQQFEATYDYPDGEQRSVSGSYIPHLSEDGSVAGYYALIVDMTERHRLEERLRQAQKMEAVGQLTGGVAHDFNNLLAVILGNAELLASHPERAEGGQQAIIRAAERGAELTRNLLAFSRKQPLSPQVIDPTELIVRMSSILQRSLGGSIDVRISLGPDLWTAMADPGQLENALLNLALNARDAMPAGGELKIDCRNSVRSEADLADDGDTEASAGDYVLLTVSDTGIGMDAETQRHVFEPFYTTKQVGAGSGLGLSMVYGFVKQSGGHVDISSTQGQGTSVKLYLPRAADEAPAAVPERADDAPQGLGETLLVIEDDPEVRELVVAMLDSLGYSVIEAADVSGARQILAAGTKVDLVLSDVVLPGDTSGPKFAAEMRVREPDLKIILMSGYPDGAVAGKDSLGPDIVLLHKPFHRYQLATAVREALK